MSSPLPAPVGFTPRPFAMLTASQGDRTVLAWGMTLPDGSAMVVDWRHGPSSVTAVCRSAVSAEMLFDGELVWIGANGARVDDYPDELEQRRGDQP
ncbi:MAG TPA: hypothetical protein VK453_13450 [Micromonosporaceae bacterium]|nr:hypothetical protein [Micromonosporaceae bacterium]